VDYALPVVNGRKELGRKHPHPALRATLPRQGGGLLEAATCALIETIRALSNSPERHTSPDRLGACPLVRVWNLLFCRLVLAWTLVLVIWFLF
jgi:hypothetical protein